MSVTVISVTMRLYHCMACDLWFQVDAATMWDELAHCPRCRRWQQVVPFDERVVPLAVTGDEEAT